MTKRFTIFASAMGCLAVLALAAGPAHAQFDKSEQKCRATVAKGLGKLVKTVGKEIGACHKAEAKEDMGIDCNDTGAANFPSKSALKIQKAIDKLTGGVPGKCQDKEANILTGALYKHISCPVTCPAAANPVETFVDVAECMACVGVDMVEAAHSTAAGNSDAAPSKEAAKCHGALLKGYQKYVDTLIKTQQKCQKDDDKNGAVTVAGCEGAGNAPADKGGAAKTKAAEGLTKACGASVPVGLNACEASGGTTADLAVCAAAAYEEAALGLFPPAYENGSTICPEFIVTRILDKISNVKLAGTCVMGTCSGGDHDGEDCANDDVCQRTATSLAIGWTGLAHNVGLPDDYMTSVGITCPGTFHRCDQNTSLCIGGPNDGAGCTEDFDCSACGDCTLDGVANSADNPQFDFFSRCKDDTSIVCTNTLGNDAACPAGGACDYILGGLLASSTSGTPTCTRNRLDADITGTVNFELGSSDLNIPLRSIVFTGVGINQPCPICVGQCVDDSGDVLMPRQACQDDSECPNATDTCVQDSPQDGVKGGLCLEGTNDWDSITATGDGTCDIHAFDASFGSTSHDCAPTSDANTTPLRLEIALELTTETVTFGADVPCNVPGESCFGAVCTDPSHLAGTNNRVGCFTTADCAGDSRGDLGVCTANGHGTVTGVNREPNKCFNYSDCMAETPGDLFGICDPTVLDGGLPVNRSITCDGLLKADGAGIVGCNPFANPMNADQDCDFTDCGLTGGGCGSCTVFEDRSCFLDNSMVIGVRDRAEPILVSVFPLPPTGNAGVDGAVGSPSIGVVTIEMRTNAAFR